VPSASPVVVEVAVAGSTRVRDGEGCWHQLRPPRRPGGRTRERLWVPSPIFGRSCVRPSARAFRTRERGQPCWLYNRPALEEVW